MIQHLILSAVSAAVSVIGIGLCAWMILKLQKRHSLARRHTSRAALVGLTVVGGVLVSLLAVWAL